MMLQADCLSVRIAADTTRLLMLLLKPVSVRPWSSNLPLSPMIYRQHYICLPVPLRAEFLTNPEPGSRAIIKNAWQDFRAGRDGFVEARRAGEDGITQVWRHMAVWLTASIPFTTTLESHCDCERCSRRCWNEHEIERNFVICWLLKLTEKGQASSDWTWQPPWFTHRFRILKCRRLNPCRWTH